MNDRPHSFDVLLGCLERLRGANAQWFLVASRHHEHLMASRLAEAEELLPPMERLLLRIADEEGVRVEQTAQLAETLGLREESPRLDALAAALPPQWAQELVEKGRALREAVKDASQLADRIRAVAEIGRRISEATITMARREATRSARPPAAYVRGGKRTVGTAVPVFNRAWRA
jgi:ribosomal protein L12E/L44/L45/RPP1/RPP2